MVVVVVVVVMVADGGVAVVVGGVMALSNVAPGSVLPSLMLTVSFAF